MIRILLFSTVLCAVTAQAQTKLISHKRHGGNAKNFKNEWFHDPSNFGAAPQRFVKNSRLDSVILISDKVAVMVTSEVCAREDWDRTRSHETVWKPGKDTVYNHVLFNGKNNEEDIREVLKQEYYFENESKSVVLVGFKKVEPEKDILQQRGSTIFKDQDSTQISELPKAKRQGRKGHFLKWIMFSVLAVFFRTPM
ncbi:MAG: hypothetical protein EP333_05575 [Bacteroidetes bacterium]|nr:MAG: hypothetical protein EP333_05575 [Bacteroidota bacterium]TNE97455.1 MAG: hypothetical protein EP322_06690 [Bacteroidota bacterium]